MGDLAGLVPQVIQHSPMKFPSGSGRPKQYELRLLSPGIKRKKKKVFGEIKDIIAKII